MLKRKFPDGAHMRAMATVLKAALPTDFCFVLVTGPFSAGGLANYVSNGERADIIKFMRETADRLEKGTTYATPENN